MTLEDQFQQEMMGGIEYSKKELQYTPTYFLRMVYEHGAMNTAKMLLGDSAVQEGLMTLSNLGRIDLSMEAMVLDRKYRSLFTYEERKVARQRLEKLDYVVGSRAVVGQARLDRHDEGTAR